MSLFDKFSDVSQLVEEVSGQGPFPAGISTDQLYSPTEGKMSGRRVLLAGTNNYLGLTFNPDIIAASKQALDAFGTGSTGSRMASGTYSGHLALEIELAEFFGKAGAILFTTGYQANLGVISTLAGTQDIILVDADSHASIYDGAKMSGAELYRFRHNDPDDLAKRLRRLGTRTDNALIILEGLYSMLGDQARLKEFVQVKKEYGGCLLVDEAHSLGVLGPQGQGLAAEQGVLDDVELIIGTFSKSLGCIGGYCASNESTMEIIRHIIRPYMFSASTTPAIIATARAALKVVSAGKELRATLWRHAHKLYNALQKMGFEVGPEPGPIVAVYMDSPSHAANAWRLLLEQNIYVNLVIPPATPSSTSLLRCSLSAVHSDKQIDLIIEGYRKVFELRASL